MGVWTQALECFVAGITGVFLVMVFLQIAISLSSKIVMGIESRTKKDDSSKG